MPSQEQIDEQRRLLETNRATLAILLTQKAHHTTAYTPPAIEHGIREARENIQRIKTALRRWNLPVDDLPDDDEVVNTPYSQNEVRNTTSPPSKTTTQIPKRPNIREIIVLAATTIVCVAAVIVVPEVRKFLVLDRLTLPTTVMITNPSLSSVLPNETPTSLAVQSGKIAFVCPRNTNGKNNIAILCDL
jgi:hypothetical protein